MMGPANEQMALHYDVLLALAGAMGQQAAALALLAAQSSASSAAAGLVGPAWPTVCHCGTWCWPLQPAAGLVRWNPGPSRTATPGETACASSSVSTAASQASGARGPSDGGFDDPFEPPPQLDHQRCEHVGCVAAEEVSLGTTGFVLQDLAAEASLAKGYASVDVCASGILGQGSKEGSGQDEAVTRPRGGHQAKAELEDARDEAGAKWLEEELAPRPIVLGNRFSV